MVGLGRVEAVSGVSRLIHITGEQRTGTILIVILMTHVIYGSNTESTRNQVLTKVILKRWSLEIPRLLDTSLGNKPPHKLNSLACYQSLSNGRLSILVNYWLTSHPPNVKTLCLFIIHPSKLPC